VIVIGAPTPDSWALLRALRAEERTRAIPLANGNSGCNQYFGSYTTDGDTLNFGQLGSTMMGCEEPVMQQETSFLQSLGTAAFFTVAGDTLTITTAADATLVFTRDS
jgi:heat shock protein HslJ